MASLNDKSGAGRKLRELVLSVERLMAEGVASGMVRGAAGEVEPLEGIEDALEAWPERVAAATVRGVVAELKASMPLVDQTLHELLLRIEVALERLAEQSAEKTSSEREPGSRARALARGAMRGALEQVEEAQPRIETLASRVALTTGRELAEGALAALTEALSPGGGVRQAGKELASATYGSLRRAVKGPAVVIGVVSVALGVAALLRRARS